MKEINRQFLLLQAIAIVLVVIGHKGSVGFEKLNDWFLIYAYHMPLFVFISGYFFSLDNLNNISLYIRKKSVHLIIPYFIYNLIYDIIVFILKRNGIINYGEGINLRTFFAEPFISGHQYAFNLAMWFVLMLFLVQVVYISFRYLCKKIKLQSETVIFIFLLALGLFAIWATKTLPLNLFLKFTCGRVLFFLPFYHFGVCWKNHLEKRDNLNTFVYFAILLAVIEQMKVSALRIDYTVVFMDFFGNWFIPYISAFVGILLWLRITKILVKYIGKSKVVEWIGSSTWDIMAHHLFVFFLINFAFYLFHYHSFNAEEFHNNIWYNFTPGSRYQTYIYYALAIAIPVCIHYLIAKIKKTNFLKIIQYKRKS